MSFLKDKEYERIQKEEWLDFAMEEYRFSVYEKLADIDKTLVPEELVKKYMYFHANSTAISIRQEGIIKDLIKLYGIEDHLEIEVVKHCSAIKLDTGSVIDLRKPIKIYAHVDFDQMKSCVVEIVGLVAEAHLSWRRPGVKRINTLIEALAKNPAQIKEIRRSKSEVDKAHFLSRMVYVIISKDLFNIKSIDLMLKFVNWIADYLDHESVYALSMITKLKAMTYSGNPIYSVEGS